jgi:hypothetical protein
VRFIARSKAPAHRKTFTPPKSRNKEINGKTTHTDIRAEIARCLYQSPEPGERPRIRTTHRDRLACATAELDSATSKTWLAMQSRGYWLKSADRFLVEIAATLTARCRIDELRSGDASLLISLLGKIGVSPNERSKMNLPEGLVRTNSSGKRKASTLQF